MVDTRNIMLCSLPCTFDFSPTGQAVPEDPDPQMIGQNVKLDRFSVAIQIVRQKMEEEVMEPLRSWLDAFNNAVVGFHANKKCFFQMSLVLRNV